MLSLLFLFREGHISKSSFEASKDPILGTNCHATVYPYTIGQGVPSVTTLQQHGELPTTIWGISASS